MNNPVEPPDEPGMNIALGIMGKSRAEYAAIVEQSVTFALENHRDYVIQRLLQLIAAEGLPEGVSVGEHCYMEVTDGWCHGVNVMTDTDPMKLLRIAEHLAGKEGSGTNG